MSTEIRGVWITNVASQVLNSRSNIREALDTLKRRNFNIIFPVVWNKGFTLFKSSVMEAHGFDEIDPIYAMQGRDPLKEIIEDAHERQIKVIPWFEYGFASSPFADGGEILRKNPEWAGIDGKQLFIKSGNLTWMNALSLEVQEFMIDLMVECAQNYDVDGIQGDDRLPAFPYYGGYDHETITRYGSNPPLPPTSSESAYHTDLQWKRWVDWRCDELTSFLSRLHSAIKSVGEKRGRTIVMSLSPNPYPWCKFNYLQDTKTWVQKQLVDTVHPQFYRPTLQRYKIEVDNLLKHFSKERHLFSPGICFKHDESQAILTPELLKHFVEVNRSKGLGGHVFFHYSGLLNKVSNVEVGTSLGSSVFAAASPLPSIFA